MPIDNPRIRRNGPVQRGLREAKQEATVRTPRDFKGSDFRSFPRLVVQLGRPRPQRGTPGVPGHFARPLRGMGAGQSARDSIQPQMRAYRDAVHSAYADGTLSPEERTGLRQQRQSLRQGVRDYRSEHPLQQGLQSRMSQPEAPVSQAIPQGPQSQTQPTVVPARPDQQSDQQPNQKFQVPEQPFKDIGGTPETLQLLMRDWQSGKLTADQVLAALGFTGGQNG